jgi:eukaryotic-like serine/threonine-protein kinase
MRLSPTGWQRVKVIFDAACDLEPAARADYVEAAAKGDMEIVAEVNSLISSHERAGNFIEALDLPPASADYGIGTNIGPYRIVQPIGAGGMGTVYQAVRVDDLYRKLVALKVVRRGLFDGVSRRRFDTERQILAHLDHPNIAKLLDGGTTPDGQPYFVMDFIAGAPLDEYCDNLRLTVRERLRLFLTVCAAVQYAHENFVVHRDIKPGNILVTADGQIRLLDFGIAKLLDPETLISEETTNYAPMMTPEFASPEQLRNLPATTASDTWSLGVLLFALLTGGKPFAFEHATAPDVYDAIRGAEPRLASVIVLGDPEAAEARRTNPGRLARELAGDLDQILLMALRTEPERRYRSVAALASDVKKHLAGLPVSARDGTWRYRAGKFMRRHRSPVVAACLAVVALSGGSIATLWEASVARRERERAERRFVDVRRVANSLLFDVHDALRGVEGAGPARAMVLERALSFLDNLARDSGVDTAGDGALERELGSAYERAGDIQTQSGDARGGKACYEKAARLREHAAALAPADSGIRRDLISNYSKLSDAAWAQGNAAVAVGYAAKGLALSRDLAAKPGAVMTDRVRLATDYLDYGYKAAALAGRRAAGIANCAEAVRLFLRLAENKSADARLLHIAAAACERTAELISADNPADEEAVQLRQNAASLRLRAAAQSNGAQARSGSLIAP